VDPAAKEKKVVDAPPTMSMGAGETKKSGEVKKVEKKVVKKKKVRRDEMDDIFG